MKKMRMTTEEIMEQTGMFFKEDAHWETIPARFYGDMPNRICKHREFEDRHWQNVFDLENFMEATYRPEKVEYYRFRNGDGYKIKGGRIICGSLDIDYGGGYPYTMHLMNHHYQQYGFWIAKLDVGKYTYQQYETEGFGYSPWNLEHCRKVIDSETLDKIFCKVEKDDTYGEFPKQLVQLARTMM